MSIKLTSWIIEDKASKTPPHLSIQYTSLKYIQNQIPYLTLQCALHLPFIQIVSRLQVISSKFQALTLALQGFSRGDDHGPSNPISWLKLPGSVSVPYVYGSNHGVGCGNVVGATIRDYYNLTISLNHTENKTFQR